MMDDPLDPRQNRLLAALPDHDLQRWVEHLELVDMPLAAVLYESGETLNYVYFPTTAIVSLRSSRSQLNQFSSESWQ